MTDVFSPPEPIKALIGFRVECHDEGKWFSNRNLLTQESMIPCGSLSAACFRNAVDHDLPRQDKLDIPLVSLFRSWERAMGFRESMVRRGGRDVVIMAVWLRGLAIFDATDVARWFGRSTETSPNGPRRRRAPNRGSELLVPGGIRAEEHRIIACFNVNGPATEPVDLSLGTNRCSLFTIRIPKGSLPTIGNTDLTAPERLAYEIHTRTGVWDPIKLSVLIQAMCGLLPDEMD